MTFNAALFSIRPAHLLVRNVEEWDALAFELTRAYDGKNDELIDGLLPPYLESWRAVTSNLLRDAFSAAGVTVAASKHPCSRSQLIASLKRWHTNQNRK